MTITHLNPESMHSNPAFSQGVLLDGEGRLLVVGGQNGVDAQGNIVSDDLGEQTVQAFRNLITVLESAGASQTDVAKLTIYMVPGGDVNAGFAAAQEVWGQHATAITVIQATPGRPDALVEIEALAFVGNDEH
ncbi:MAG: RidA family protein [Acidimicrobiia bacterium]|nr:RidA family protein [Acidimicrobiia bacterium]